MAGRSYDEKKINTICKKLENTAIGLVIFVIFPISSVTDLHSGHNHDQSLKQLQQFPTHLQMCRHLLGNLHHLCLGHPLIDLLDEDPCPDRLSHRSQCRPGLVAFGRLRFGDFFPRFLDQAPVLDLQTLRQATFAPNGGWKHFKTARNLSKDFLHLQGRPHLPGQQDHYPRCSCTDSQLPNEVII